MMNSLNVNISGTKKIRGKNLQIAKVIKKIRLKIIDNKIINKIEKQKKIFVSSNIKKGF